MGSRGARAVRAMPPESASPAREEQRVGLRWLVRMRWGAIASELAAIAVARAALGLELPLAPMLGVIALSAATNVVLARRPGERLPAAMTAALLFDVAALTALLRWGGGSSNPFSAVYLVYVTLGAVLLAPRAVAALVIASAVGYGLLFVGAEPGAHDHHAHHGAGGGDVFGAHLYGMYVALVASAVLVGYFVSRLSSAVREREAELREARRRAADAERLAALTTLCAGAAHELGTPLGTIALAASELARTASASGDPRLASDAELVRSEVARCRAILDRMAARFGESVGDRPERVAAARIADAIVALVPAGERPRVEVHAEASASACVPVGAVAQAAANLVENALEAGAGTVELHATRAGGELRLAIVDRGAGMPDHVAARATEPFFTTKEAGRGMGLGLYLCRVTAERLGGRLELRSAPGRGTEALLAIPDAEPATP